MKDILKTSKETIIIFSLVLSIALFICIILLAFEAVSLDDISDFSIILNNFITPFLTCTAVILTFLAFYVQKIANDDLKEELKNQKESRFQDFNFQSLKDSVTILNNDINNFNISFVGNKLVTSMDVLNKTHKKYNFIGVQGMALFLFQYFNEKTEHKYQNLASHEIRNLASHANYSQISNIIYQFSNLYIATSLTRLSEEQQTEIYELMKYVYTTKLNFIVDIIRNHNPDQHLLEVVNDLYSIFNYE